jgi:hypothetical protein
MTLRPMLMSDADFMLELKNDPATRKFAIISKEEIKREDHIKWLENNIQYFCVIEAFGGSERVGAIRIQDNEVSIWVDKEFRRANIAKGILIMETKPGMKAKIVDGNIPSMRAFIRAGFLPVSYHDNYYTFQK